MEDNPALDSLIVWFMVESGARDEGMLGLRLRDLDRDRCTVLLREKNDTDGCDQPISPGLLTALDAFARSRGAARSGPFLMATRFRISFRCAWFCRSSLRLEVLQYVSPPPCPDSPHSVDS